MTTEEIRQYPTFDERRMRSHLAECFNEGKMTPFPKAMAAMNLNCVVHKEPIRVYCSCRMPEHFDTNMITCDVCKEWFHSFKCAKLKTLPTKWICYQCKNKTGWLNSIIYYICLYHSTTAVADISFFQLKEIFQKLMVIFNANRVHIIMTIVIFTL